jgi:hypothetical protein
MMKKHTSYLKNKKDKRKKTLKANIKATTTDTVSNTLYTSLSTLSTNTQEYSLAVFLGSLKNNDMFSSEIIDTPKHIDCQDFKSTNTTNVFVIQDGKSYHHSVNTCGLLRLIACNMKMTFEDFKYFLFNVRSSKIINQSQIENIRSFLSNFYDATVDVIDCDEYPLDLYETSLIIDCDTLRQIREQNKIL